MGHKIGDLEKIKKKLDQLPAINESEREVTKQEAIKRIAPAIVALQNRGYSMERIAEIITGEGLEIKVQSLKSYLTRAKKPAKNKSQRGQKTRSSRNMEDDKLMSKAVPVDVTIKASTDLNNTTKKDLKKGAFRPRDDTSDI